MLAAATRDNRHLIGAAELARMTPGSKLVLLSRADVVDFRALQNATASGRIEAAIDVFPEEPVASDDPIRGTAGILLSAHRAGGLDSALKTIGAMVVDDLGARAPGPAARAPAVRATGNRRAAAQQAGDRKREAAA